MFLAHAGRLFTWVCRTGSKMVVFELHSNVTKLLEGVIVLLPQIIRRIHATVAHWVLRNLYLAISGSFKPTQQTTRINLSVSFPTLVVCTVKNVCKSSEYR